MGAGSGCLIWVQDPSAKPGYRISVQELGAGSESKTWVQDPGARAGCSGWVAGGFPIIGLPGARRLLHFGATAEGAVQPGCSAADGAPLPLAASGPARRGGAPGRADSCFLLPGSTAAPRVLPIGRPPARSPPPSAVRPASCAHPSRVVLALLCRARSPLSRFLSLCPRRQRPARRPSWPACPAMLSFQYPDVYRDESSVSSTPALPSDPHPGSARVGAARSSAAPLPPAFVWQSRAGGLGVPSRARLVPAPVLPFAGSAQEPPHSHPGAPFHASARPSTRGVPARAPGRSTRRPGESGRTERAPACAREELSLKDGEVVLPCPGGPPIHTPPPRKDEIKLSPLARVKKGEKNRLKRPSSFIAFPEVCYWGATPAPRSGAGARAGVGAQGRKPKPGW